MESFHEAVHRFRKSGIFYRLLAHIRYISVRELKSNVVVTAIQAAWTLQARCATIDETGHRTQSCKGREREESMSQTRRAFLCAGAAALVSQALPQTAAWPTRPLKIVIPTAAGGSP